MKQSQNNRAFKLPNKIKLRTYIGLGLLAILLPIVLISLFKPVSPQAAWFDGGYGYRKAITFTHDTALTDRRVSFTVDTAALTTDKMQADCDDTRFTDANGKLLDFQVVSGCDSASTQYDVVFPTIINGGNLAYMYYGNPSAVGASTDVSAVTSLSPSGGAGSFAAEEVTPGVIAEWKLDEGSGTTTQDSSSNNADGSVSGATWLTEDQCVSGKCLRFDGTDDLVDVSGTVNGIQTVSFWVRLQSVATTEQLIDLNGTDYITSVSGTLTVSGFGTETIYIDGRPDTTLTANRWHHVEVATSSGFTGSGIKIGQIGTDFGQAIFDEIKFYPYTRSADQIQLDYAGGVARFGNDQDFSSDGLVGYWKLDEASGNAIDSSGNSITLTDASSTTYTNGKYANGADLELSSTDYLYAADNTALSITGSLSIAAWIKPETVSAGTYNIAGKWDGANESYRLMQNADELRLELDSSGNYAETTASNLAAGTWYHVVATYNTAVSPSEVTIIINGVQATTSTTGTIPTSIGDDTGRFHIGAQDSTTTPAGYYDGIVDEVRLYSRTLTPAEAASLYNSAPMPIAYWKMDDNTASTATDSSSNANDLSLTNAPTWENGKFGTSVLFSGSNQHLIRADDSDFDFADDASFTISAYIKHKTATAQEIILSKYQEAGYKIIMESDGDITCALDYDSTWSPTDSATSTAANYDDNAWHHVACVKNGATSLNLYIDGVLITSDTSLTATNTLTNSDPLYVGIDADGASNDYTGNIDDLKIYTYARSVEQLQNDLEGKNEIGQDGVKVPQPTVYYRMDEGQGTVAHNSSPTTLNGTLTNAVFKPNGKVNGTAYFDGTADYITMTSNQALDGRDGITFSMWINPSSVTNSVLPTIYNRGDQSNTVGFHWIFFNGGNNLHYQYSNGSQYKQLALGATVTLGSWQHLAITHDRINRIVKTYLNGVLMDTDAAGEEMKEVTSGNALLGTYKGAFASYYFQGYIDEFKIYDTVLTSGQIVADMNAGAATNIGSTASSEAAQLTDGAGNPPVGYWSFDEKQDNTCTGGANDVCDKSGNGYDGASMNSPLWVAGKYGSALKFNGSSSYVALPDNLTDTHTTGTVCSWVYYNKTAPAVGSQGAIFSVGDSGGVVSKHVLYILDTADNPAEIRAVIRPDGVANDEYVYASASNIMPRQQWTHLCFRQQGNGSGVELFKNGVEIPMTATNSGAGSLDDWFDDGASSVENVTIGIIEDNDPDTWLDGSVDEFKLYNYARTDAQIAYDYNRGEPVNYWRMDECQGSTTYDSGSSGQNGTITAGDTSGSNDSIGTCGGSAGEMWADGASGKLNASLEFDGTNDYIALPDNLMDSQSMGSVCAWVYYDQASDLGAQGTFFSYSDDATENYQDTFQISDAGASSAQVKITIRSDTTSNSVNYTANNNAISRQTWQHLCVTQDGAGVDIYINGRAVAVSYATQGTGALSDWFDDISSTAEKATIGNVYDNSPDSYFPGKIDDVRIYNYALSASQVKNIYNGGAVNFSQ